MVNVEKLVQLRKSKKWIQSDVARELGIERTTYGKYESGGIQPPVDMVSRLADCFGVSVDYLLDRSEFPSFPYGDMSTKKEVMAQLSPEETLHAMGLEDEEAIRLIVQMIRYAKDKSRGVMEEFSVPLATR